MISFLGSIICHHSQTWKMESMHTKQNRYTQNRIADFRKCWLKYFAPNLLSRNKWFRKRENVQVGDLVLELDPKRKKCQWKMALITDVHRGSDGLVRKVRMKTQTGEYARPIHKLCLIATREELDAGQYS